MCTTPFPVTAHTEDQKLNKNFPSLLGEQASEGISACIAIDCLHST